MFIISFTMSGGPEVQYTKLLQMFLKMETKNEGLCFRHAVLHLFIEVCIPVLLIHRLVAATYTVITSLLKQLAYTLRNKEGNTALKRFLWYSFPKMICVSC